MESLQEELPSPKSDNQWQNLSYPKIPSLPHPLGWEGMGLGWIDAGQNHGITEQIKTILNEVGKNAGVLGISDTALGLNATMDETVLVFERVVRV